MEPTPPALEGEVLTSGPPGKFQYTNVLNSAWHTQSIPYECHVLLGWLKSSLGLFCFPLGVTENLNKIFGQPNIIILIYEDELLANS